VLHTFRAFSELFWQAVIDAKAISPLRSIPTSQLAGSSVMADKNKLNWNKTQFDSFFPITLAGSKQIGTIYKWCPPPPR
jgi:hypothetical protein